MNTEERSDIVESVELLARARAGDAEAYCTLAGASETRLFRQAVALCHTPATAEDLVVETLAEAWRNLPRFNQTCRFSTWLYAILLHRHQKLLRASRSRPVPLASLHPVESTERESLLEASPDLKPLPPEILQQKEFASQINQAIESLPPIHQEVIQLRFFEGASLPEIAGALGLPLGTVKSRLHHALDHLRQKKTLMNLFDSSEDT